MASWSDPGTYTWDVPSDADYVDILVRGGSGGDGDDDSSWAGSGTSAGGGASAEVWARVHPSNIPSTLRVIVGGDGDPGDAEGATGGSGGSNGGGDGVAESYVASGGGGGATEIEDDADGSRLFVAGGGGGGAAARGTDVADAGAGGAGGTLTGADGETASTNGSTSSGGSGGDSSLGTKSGANGVNSGNGDGEAAASGPGGGGATGAGAGDADVDNTYGTGTAGGGGGGGSYIGPTVESSSTATAGSSYAQLDAVTPSASNLSSPYTGFTEVDLDWSGEDADEYEIERDGTVIATVTSSSYTDLNIAANTTYTYQVFAVASGTREDSTSKLDVTTGGPPTSTSLTQDDYDHTLTASEPNGDYDELRLYRTNATTSFSQVDAVADASSYSYSETVTLDGLAYEYEFRAVYSRGGETSGVQETGVATPLPGPSDIQITNTTADTFDVSWLLNNDSNGSGGVRILRSRDDGQTWVEGPDQSAGTESATTEQLRHGEEYRLAVEVFTADTSTITAPGLKAP